MTALPRWHPPSPGAEVAALSRSRADTLTLGLDQAPPADARLSHLVGSSRPGGRQRVRAAAPLPRDALESREGTLRGKEETLLEGAGAWGQKPPGTRR